VSNPTTRVLRRLEPDEIACVQPLVRELEAALMEEQRVKAIAAQQVTAARARLGLMVRLLSGPEEREVILDPDRMVLLGAGAPASE
jgi:hypothetical protein